MDITNYLSLSAKLSRAQNRKSSVLGVRFTQMRNALPKWQRLVYKLSRPEHIIDYCLRRCFHYLPKQLYLLYIIYTC